MRLVPFWRTSVSDPTTRSQQFYFKHFEIHPIMVWFSSLLILSIARISYWMLNIFFYLPFFFVHIVLIDFSRSKQVFYRGIQI